MTSQPEQGGGQAESLTRLTEQLSRLPGIGPRSAQRLAYHVIRAPKEETRELAEALLGVIETVRFCSICQNVTQTDPCPRCALPVEDQSIICVVEEPLDVVAIERSGAFKGRYHVLHGLLSPMDGVTPENLRIRELIERLRDDTVKEVIIATNPSMEGEVTAMYVQGLIAPLGVRVTRLARGLPSGSDLEFADAVTVARALEGRQEF
ncbi:MAG: recombination protein RecR [Dehalococcoidia bacterium]|nr:recombination protein RecR [Dehalococcoidia bacterium]